MDLLEKYIEACNYPGVLDEAAVNASLKRYCEAIGVKRQVKRITRPWWRDLGLLTVVAEVAGGIAMDAIDARAAIDARDARAALAARDAMDARAALAARDARAARAARDARAAREQHGHDWAVLLREFGNWCLFNGGWWTWDCSWLAATLIGARQLGKTEVERWSHHCCEAYLSGAWLLFWTGDALYWCAKPSVSVLRTDRGVRQLHCEDGPACANEIENLYFLRGVIVPAYAVVDPSAITVEEIKAEQNEEVRRILIERFGWPKYLTEINASRIHARRNDVDGTRESLYRADEQTVLVCACPSTAKVFALEVPREIATCEAAQHYLSSGLSVRVISAS